MTLYSRSDFDAFFDGYAPNVEGFYEVAYWSLADAVIQELARKHLNVRPGDHIIDAGGGTGRWACWYAQNLDVRVTIADKSEAMLAEAEKVVAQAGLSDRISLVLCDLENAPELADASFDGLMSTYGVLSFLDRPAAAYETFARVLKPGSHGLLMSHSLSNALASKVNRDGASAAELEELLTTRIVRWSPSVPPLRVYSTTDLAGLATDAGLEPVDCFGVTAIASPGADDFGYPYTRTSEISKRLTDPEWFRQALRLELAAAQEPGWAERGTNLMQLVRRPA